VAAVVVGGAAVVVVTLQESVDMAADLAGTAAWLDAAAEYILRRAAEVRAPSVRRISAQAGHGGAT
jgi:tRNA A58 N-methylase Trm61